MRPDLPQTFKRFWRSRRGVAAVEFALLVPMLLVAYLGATDLTQGLAIDRKLGQLSATVGDLVARETNIDEGKVLAFFDTGRAIMRPFEFDQTRLLLTVVKVDGGSAEITAVAEHNWPTTLQKGDSYTLPAETMAVADGRHVVITNAGYTFTPLFSTVFDGSMQLAQSSTNVLRNDIGDEDDFGFPSSTASTPPEGDEEAVGNDEEEAVGGDEDSEAEEEEDRIDDEHDDADDDGNWWDHWRDNCRRAWWC